MTKFIVYEVAVKENDREKFEKTMRDENYMVRQKTNYIITNLVNFFDNKQKKINE